MFFSEDRLLGQYVNLRYWNSVSALLVGLGILGTFVGLVWGLTPFSDINFTQTEEIQEAIKELLSGVSTAFVTSVWGMLASILFNWVEKWGIRWASRAIANLQRELDRLFTLKTQEEIAIRQEDELAQQTAALKSFSTDLSDRLRIAIDNVMSERLAPSLNSLNTSVEKLREEKTENSLNAVQNLVDEFKNSLTGAVTTQMETLAETVGAASQSLKSLPNQMEQMIAGVQEKIDQTHQLMSDTSQEQTKQMDEMFKKAIDEQQKSIDLVTNQLANVFEQSTETLKIGIAQMQQTLDSTTLQLSELVDRSAARLNEIFQTGERSLGALVEKQSMQSEAISLQLDASREFLVEGREILQQMNSSVTNVRQMIETMQGFSEQLNEGAARIDDAGQRLTRASDTFNEENKRYFAANLETTQKLQEIAQRFQVIDKGLSEIFAEIQRGLNNYAVSTRESINRYLGEFSDQLASASAALANSVDGLSEVVEEFREMKPD